LPELRVLSGRKVCTILARSGFNEVRRSSSHIVMQKRRGNSTITAIVPDHGELKTGTLRSIIRQSQLPRRLFEVR